MLSKLPLIMLVLATSATAMGKSYDMAIRAGVSAGNDMYIRPAVSTYEPGLERCWKPQLHGYDLTYRIHDEDFKEALKCYSRENARLKTKFRLDFKNCDQAGGRGFNYDLANCYQSLFIEAHNQESYGP